MIPVIGMALSVEKDDFYMGAAYVRAIEQAGGVVLGIPPSGEPSLDVFERLDGVLIPGGADVDPYLYDEDILPENGVLEPERDRLEMWLVRWSLQHKRAILGICRGMQMLNVAAGGSLYQDIPSQTGTRLQHRQKAPRWYATHGVSVEPNTRLASIFGTLALRVNTFHHQAVRSVAPGLVVSARATDGIVEAIESPDHPFAVGVQWHPEAMLEQDAHQGAVFRAFVQAAAKRHQQRPVGEHAG